MVFPELHDSKLDTWVTEKDKSVVYFACEEMSKCVCSSNFRLQKEKLREKKIYKYTHPVL